jgi:ATP-dependent Clp protease protease subunit
LKRLEEHFNAEDQISLRLLSESVYYLSGDIEEETITPLIKWLLYEGLNDKENKTLTIYINSIGGDLYQAFALIDIMKTSPHKIRTVGVGSVMSAAFLIFASGTQGQRYSTANTSFMCHQYSDTTEGKHHDLKATMKEGESCNQRMVDILKDASGLTAAKVKSKLLPASDVYLTPQEALELGIVDTIL